MSRESPFWKAPEMWPGSTVFVIGGGTSLVGMDWSRLKGKKLVACNDAYAIGDMVQVLYFGDWGWYQIHKRWLGGFGGLKVTCAAEGLSARELLTLQRMPRGFFLEPQRIGWNDNTGASAVNLAVKLGAVKVVLLGFDMKLGHPTKDYPKGNSNWYENLKNKPNAGVYQKFLDRFKDMDAAMKEKAPHVRVINTSMDSALDLYPKMTLEEVLKDE